MQPSLSGKPLAVVTGASSGIGFELAKQFAENGFDVILNAEDAGLTVAAEALRELGTQIEAVQADLSTYPGVEQLAAAILAANRPVDAIALNAGIGVGGRFVETDLARELELIGLNVTSTVHLAKRVIPGMVERGEGRVLFTSSIAATMPGPYEAVYAASKAFVRSFSEALQYELKDSGVTVTAILPGPTDTEFFERADLEDTRIGQGPKDDPAAVAKQGFEAMMAGKDFKITGGLKTKLMGQTNKIMPEALKAKAHTKMAEPGSGSSSS